MKTKVLFTMTALFLITGWAVKVKADSSKETIQIDKGRVLLTLGKAGAETEIHAFPTEGCQAQVAITREAGKIVAKHDNKPCPSGSRFEMTIDPAKATHLRLQAGIVELTEGEKVFSVLRKLKASVKAGLVENASAKIKVTRTADYAGAEVNYENAKGLKGSSLELLVEAGTIKL